MIVLKRAVCVMGVLLAACGSGTSEVPLAILADEQDAHDGRVVSTRGTVIPVEDAPGADEYFVLEDNAGNRVRLLPDAWASKYTHQSVVVTGAFEFDPDRGRELHIRTIEPTG